MSQENREFSRSYVANADLSSSRHRVAQLSGDNQVTAATGTGQNIVGVIKNTPKSGEAADVQYLGTTKVEAGASISRGDYLVATTGGKVTSTTTEGDHIVGFALEATSNGDGDIIEMMLYPNVQYTSTAS